MFGVCMWGRCSDENVFLGPLGSCWLGLHRFSVATSHRLRKRSLSLAQRPLGGAGGGGGGDHLTEPSDFIQTSSSPAVRARDGNRTSIPSTALHP